MVAMEDLVAGVKLTSNIISCSSRTLEFTLVIFLISQYFRPKSNYKSAYFVILNIGYMADLIAFINWLIPMNILIYYFTLVVIEWYMTYFLTIWNVVLCINRCTALAFSVKYEKIWTPFTMFFVILFMLAFPFIVDGYTIFSSNCSVQNFVNCLLIRRSYYFKGTIINAILNGIIIILIGICMYFSRKDKFQAHSSQAKTERTLIYQAIFSSIFQLIYFILKFCSALSDGTQWFLMFMYISNIMYHIHHYVVMLTHFILSPTFKMAYLNFYHIGKLGRSSRTTTFTTTAANVSKTMPTTNKVVSSISKIVM